jgi:sensor domain CHASE-containing protein
MSTKKKSTGKMRFVVLQVFALLLSIAAGYFIWLHTITLKEQHKLDQLSQQNAKHQQHVVQNHLVLLTEKVTPYSHNENLSSGLLSADADILSHYQSKLMKDITNLKSVRFFSLDQAQIEETDIPVNFVIMDMINRSERDEVVHPEVVRHKKDNTWFIAVVAPIYQTIDKTMEQPALPVKGESVGEKVIGTMYLAVSIDALQMLLSSLDQTLGQTQVSQKITDKKFTTFLVVGDAGNYRTQQLAIANSHWQQHHIFK